MGNSPFRPPKKESEEERRQRLIAKYGVKIPPSFACPSPFQDNNTMPLCSQSLFKAKTSCTTTPSIIENLWTTHSGRRLLQEYISPGVWLSAGGSVPSSALTGSSERSILVTLDTSKTTALSSTPTRRNNAAAGRRTTPTSSSSLWAGQQNISLGRVGSASVQLHAPIQGNPSLHVAYAPIPQFQVETCLGAAGAGWLGAKVQTHHGTHGVMHDDDQVKVVAGSFFPFHPTSDSAHPTKTKTPLSQTVHAYGVTEFKQSLLAMEAVIPLDVAFGATSSHSQHLPSVSTMLTININDAKDATSAPPPLWFTLLQKKTNKSSEMIMNVNQTLTFDRRKVPNPFRDDDLAPNVRQTLGWAVQWTKRDDLSSLSSPLTNLSVGVTWQLNRALGVKGLVHQNTGMLEYALICKRWNYPRMTLSVLNQFQLFGAHSNDHKGRHSFVGFGIELETTPFTAHKEQDYGSATPMVPRTFVPPSRVHLP
jgi:hypothetical protein